MKIVSGILIGLACFFLLASCNQKQAQQTPVPQSPTRDDIGYFCGMIVEEHKGPKSQLFLSGNAKPLWFTSVRDGIAYTLLPEETGTVLALFVTTVDAADWDHPEQQPQAWINADQAWYVVGSQKRGGMGAAEAIPFKSETAAQGFTEKYGGQVKRLADIPNNYILGNSEVNANTNSL